MATYNKREFAELCGIETRHLAVYINRKKVIVLESGVIDDTDPVNKVFIEKHSGKKKTKAKPAKQQEKPEKNDLYNLEKQQKALSIEAKRREIALTEARLQRLHGQLMPTEVVYLLFAQHFKEVNAQFKQGIDGILSEFAKKLHANSNQLSEMRAVMVKILNDCIKKSTTNSKNSIESVLKELSQVKRTA